MFFISLTVDQNTTKMKLIIFVFLITLYSCAPEQAGNSTTIIEKEVALYDYDVEEKIKSLGIILKEPGKPVANYVNAVTTGNLVFMAGKGSGTKEGELITGKIGKDLSIEEGYEAARLTGVAQLAALKAEIGNLNRVERIVKVTGMVNCGPTFVNQPEVINGFSDLMVEVFGERGKHARAAVGMGSLPRNLACEIDMIVQIKN